MPLFLDVLHKGIDVIELDHADRLSELRDDHERISGSDSEKIADIRRDDHLSFRSDGHGRMDLDAKPFLVLTAIQSVGVNHTLPLECKK